MSDAGQTIVNPEVIEAASQALNRIAGDIENSFREAQAKVEELTPDFQGSAGEASRAFYEQLNTQALQFHESFVSYAQAVGIAGDSFAQTNTQVRGMFPR